MTEQLPDPGGAGSLDDLTRLLRSLKEWAGDPPFDRVTERVNAVLTAAGRPAGDLVGRTTVVDCFRPGRRRLAADLLAAVVEALHPDPGYVTQWRQALSVVSGSTRAAAQVRVADRLPPDLPGFTGRKRELDRVRAAVGRGLGVVITGMAGIGKTRLAVRAGHKLCHEMSIGRVLHVDLRGFPVEGDQPPAEPSAVLEGFLRLLGVPARRVPHGLDARVALYRERLSERPTLIVLDNAVGDEQVRPLLPETTGCVTLVTSRRRLDTLAGVAHVVAELFGPDEAMTFLLREAGRVPPGDDPESAIRIARSCGRLPLALALVGAHIARADGWTLTDHAERLDERHATGSVEHGVALALDVSYRALPPQRRRVLRLAALHPGQDLAAHAVAALAGTSLPDTVAHLRGLCHDHLLQATAPGRYAFHELIQADAVRRAADEDPPSARRAALTRLLDHWLTTAGAAMDVLHPAERDRRPPVPPAAAAVPDLPDTDAALAWLDAERQNLVAATAHAAGHGWPAHAVAFSGVLFRYLAAGHTSDALTLHGHALDAARDLGDAIGEATASLGLGATYLYLSRYGPAVTHLDRAATVFGEAGSDVGQARAINNLGIVALRRARYRAAVGYYARGLELFRGAGDVIGTARVLGNLGFVEVRLGRYASAVRHYERSLELFRAVGDRTGEAVLLSDLGEAELRRGDHRTAAVHLERALQMCRALHHRTGEAWTLDSLGTLHARSGRPADAADLYRQALAAYRDTGDRDGEAWACNGLGEAALLAGDPSAAIAHHTAALAVAAEIGAPDQRARAHRGLGYAHRASGAEGQAKYHLARALDHYARLETADAAQIRAALTPTSR